MTQDLNESVKPLALRVAPFEGEAWPAYLERTAHEYRCHPATLVEPISRRWANRLRRGAHTACTSGISMTLPVAEATAQRLNLSRTEILAMQMSAHQGLTLSVDEDTTALFDPVLGHARTSDIGTVGWMAHPMMRRWCRVCDQERPDVDLLIWRYPWVTVCNQHDVLLYPCNKADYENATWDEWEELFDTQDDLEDILEGRR